MSFAVFVGFLEGVSSARKEGLQRGRKRERSSAACAVGVLYSWLQGENMTMITVASFPNTKGSQWKARKKRRLGSKHDYTNRMTNDTAKNCTSDRRQVFVV